MEQKENVMLGTSTNLILGFDPNWQPGKMGSNGLLSTSDKPLEEREIDIPQAGEEGYEWSYPKITIHDDAESLLQEIFPFRLSAPSDGTDEMKVNMGALLIGDGDREDSVKKLSETLGVKLCEKYGYVLVRMERISGESKHPVCKGGIILHPNPKHKNEEMGICENFRSDLIKIRNTKENGFVPALFTVKKAQICLDFYKKYGTHFVSQAICGDAIFQVLAYEQEKYGRIKSIYGQNDFNDEKSLNFMPYITDANTGAYGYVKEYGKILCYSGDSQLAQDLKTGKWLDKQWSGRDSIFSPFLWNSPMNRLELNSNYSKNLPLYYTLTPLAIFAEHGRRLALKRVMKGAMIQKFGAEVKPYFSKYFPYDKADLPFGNDIQGFVSNLATRNINAYKPALNFDELQFVASQNTESFTLVSNLLSASSSRHTFPGKEVVLVFQNADFESDDFVTVVELEQEAYEKCVISCKDFYGGIQIVSKDRSQHITIVDGICYVTEDKKDSARQMIVAHSDIRQNYGAVNLQSVRNSIICSYTFANSVLSSRTDENGISSSYRFAKEMMSWLSEMISNSCDDMELMNVRILALDDIRMSQSDNQIAYVPILSPEKYSENCIKIIECIDAIQHQIDCYQQKIEQRKTQELIVDVGKALNENIIESGKLLSEFIQANAKQQQELAQYYEAIISVKNSEMKQLNKKTDLLELELNKQKARMKNAVIAYKEAVDVWKMKAEIKFGLDAATTLFTAATSILVPASAISAVKDLGLVVQRIQKLLNILNNIHKLYTVTESSVSVLKNAETALKDLDDCDFDVTHSSWDECSIQLNYILNLGPDIAEKRALLKEFSLLMLKGKNYMSAKSSAVQLSRDIYNQQRMKVYSVKQQERLDALSHDLEPENLQSLDAVSVDLAGFTGDFIFLRSQMFAMLSKAFLLYDQSLQYKNLQPATHITSFDLMSFKSAIVRQSANTIEAETKLAALQVSRTKGIDVKVKVPVSQLTNGNCYVLSITPDNLKFSEYVDVRIRSVIVKIDGIAKADNNKYFVRLNYPGNTFSNRDIENNLIMFRTNARERIYEYNADTGQPNFADEGESWSENVSAVTPFSEWEISLPEKRNSGLEFVDVMAEITLTFVLDARIVNRVMLLRSVNELPNTDTLIEQMAGKTVLNGWDVVFNMSLQKIQDVLNKQYDDLKQSTSYGGNIDITTESIVSSKTTGLKKLKLEYGYPKLSFLADNTMNVKMEIPILSGTVQNGERRSEGESWDPPVNVNDGAYVTAHIPLGKAVGKVNGSESKNILSVVIDFAQGVFVANQMEVINDDDKAAFNAALINYFANNPVIFIINSLNMNQISALDDLKPSEFIFKTLITAQGTQILQLFIMTNRRKHLNYSLANLNNVSEPIPIGSECSLFISSERFFKDIMPQSFKKNGWSMAGLEPDDNFKNWTGKISQGLLMAAVDLSRLNRDQSVLVGYTNVTYKYTYYVDGGCVTLDVSDMKLEPDKRKVKVSFLKTESQSFVEQCAVMMPTYTKTTPELRTLSSDYTLEIKADIPLTIGGSGRNQKISMMMENKDCQITGHLSGGGPCGCGDDIQAMFNQQLQQQLPDKVKENLNVDFGEISLFAIKNLLFVNNDYITFKDVAIPGDVVITGIFNKS